MYVMLKWPLKSVVDIPTRVKILQMTIASNSGQVNSRQAGPELNRCWPSVIEGGPASSQLWTSKLVCVLALQELLLASAVCLYLISWRLTSGFPKYLDSQPIQAYTSRYLDLIRDHLLKMYGEMLFALTMDHL